MSGLPFCELMPPCYCSKPSNNFPASNPFSSPKPNRYPYFSKIFVTLAWHYFKPPYSIPTLRNWTGLGWIRFIKNPELFLEIEAAAAVDLFNDDLENPMDRD